MNNDKKKQTPRKNKKPFNKRNQYDKFKHLEEKDEVVYRTRPSGAEKKADWQLKLNAISDCFELQDKENYHELVEKRFQELKHKQG